MAGDRGALLMEVVLIGLAVLLALTMIWFAVLSDGSEWVNADPDWVGGDLGLADASRELRDLAAQVRKESERHG